MQEVCRGRGQEKIVTKSYKTACQRGSSKELVKQEGKCGKGIKLEMILGQEITKSIIDENRNLARRIF